MVTKIATVVFFASYALDYFLDANLAVVTAVAAGVAAVALVVE